MAYASMSPRPLGPFVPICLEVWIKGLLGNPLRLLVAYLEPRACFGVLGGPWGILGVSWRLPGDVLGGVLKVFKAPCKNLGRYQSGPGRSIEGPGEFLRALRNYERTI